MVRAKLVLELVGLVELGVKVRARARARQG